MRRPAARQRLLDSQALIKANERALTEKLVIRNNLDAIADRWLTGIMSNLSVSGNVLTKTEDGTLNWGTFEVRNSSNKSFYFGHDGSGIGKEWDYVNALMIERDLG